MKEQPGYGYDLVTRPKKLGIDDDSASVYRALRALEEKHAVSSHWHASSTGPARHVYRLTPVGEERLHAAAEAAVEMHATIQQYFCRYTTAESRPLDMADSDDLILSSNSAAKVDRPALLARESSIPDPKGVATSTDARAIVPR